MRVLPGAGFGINLKAMISTDEFSEQEGLNKALPVEVAENTTIPLDTRIQPLSLDNKMGPEKVLADEPGSDMVPNANEVASCAFIFWAANKTNMKNSLFISKYKDKAIGG